MIVYLNVTLRGLELKTFIVVSLNCPLFSQMWIFAGDFIGTSGQTISGNEQEESVKS